MVVFFGIGGTTTTGPYALEGFGSGGVGVVMVVDVIIVVVIVVVGVAARVIGEGFALPVRGTEPFEEGAEGGHAAGYKGEVVFYAARFWIKCVGG